MKRNNIKGSAILCFASLLWGLAFVAQSDAANLIPPYIFNSLRSFIGAAFLLAFILIKNAGKKQRIIPANPADRRLMLIGSLVCGVLLTVSVNLQQFGLMFYPRDVATEARGGFLTALYVILVPVFSVFFGKRIGPAIWVAVMIAMGGIYLLCLSGGISGIYLGDVLIFLCAVSFTFHIFAIDKFGDPIGGVKLSMLQFLICGILSGLLSLFTETVKWEDIVSAAPQILYLGIMSSGVAYTLQIVGQKYAEPAIASLSMSLESVFAALGGWLISGNTLSPREITGCTLVFAAIVLAQTPQLFHRAVSSAAVPAEEK